jgi:hypothetical protein
MFPSFYHHDKNRRRNEQKCRGISAMMNVAVVWQAEAENRDLQATVASTRLQLENANAEVGGALFSSRVGSCCARGASCIDTVGCAGGVGPWLLACFFFFFRRSRG